jgi:hypothetical protein
MRGSIFRQKKQTPHSCEVIRRYSFVVLQKAVVLKT